MCFWTSKRTIDHVLLCCHVILHMRRRYSALCAVFSYDRPRGSRWSTTTATNSYELLYNSQMTTPRQQKHHSHQKRHVPRHKAKPYYISHKVLRGNLDYISHKVLRDNVVSADYMWAKNHLKNINNTFQSMEPLWQTTAANDPLHNKIVSGNARRPLRNFVTIKKHHLFWNEAAATTEDSETFTNWSFFFLAKASPTEEKAN